MGNVKSVKDKRGITSETDYDDLYRPIEKRKAKIRLASYEYDAAGNLTAETDANNNRTEHTYTKRNQKEKSTFADNSHESFTYDGNGNLKTETDEEGVVTTHGYDRENRLIATEREGETTQKSYDAMGDLAAVIHPEGNSRTYEYDKLKRLAKAIDDPWGPSLATHYEYDKNNNLTKTTDVRGNIVESTYDELNRKTKHIQHKGTGNLTTYFDYDEEGNLTKLTDAKGQESTYIFDPLNRRTESHYSGLDIVNGYDANNNPTSSSVAGTSSDSTTSTYDDFDRLLTSLQRGTKVSYTYDNNGNRTSVSTPGNSTSYTYDARNRVKTATANSAKTGFDYYADGKKKSADYPNGAKEEYEYFRTYRVKSITNSISGTPISKFDYTYDKNGNRKTQDETRGARSISTTYDYDTLDRMTNYSVTENSTITKTDYTFEGYNRKTETITKPDNTSIAKTYSYDETDWLTSIQDGAKTITYSYDNNGNTTKKSDSSDIGNELIFEYDARDKLTRTTKGAATLGRYVYNANGYRIRQLGSDRGDVEYIYDGTAVIEERNASGLLAHYRYANKLYSLNDGTGNQYYHQDALGSTVDLTDDTGTTKASYFLNPWGMILESIGNSVNRRVFTGKEIDQNTGLIYFGARYYDPDTARFITQDSYLGKQDTPPSLHRYLYAYSNPTVYIDLEGYAAWDDIKKGSLDAWKDTKTAVKAGWNVLPHVTQKMFAEFDKALDNAYDTALKNNIPGMKNRFVQGALTTGVTGTKAILGMGSYPLVKASQLSEYTKDMTQIQNFPIVASGLRDTFNASKEFANKASLDSGAKVAQSAAGTFLEAVGFTYGVKSVGELYSGAGPKSGITVEPGPQVVEGYGSTLSMDGHKIYDSKYSPQSSNPNAQYRFSDPTYRSTGGDFYFGDNSATAFFEVRKDLKGKSLYSGKVHADNILDLNDPKVLNKMNIDSAKVQAPVNDVLSQKRVYDYTNSIANQAFEKGYNGIAYPSSQNIGGKAAILFDGRYNPGSIDQILNFKIK